jgi:hypothetical protein
MTQVKKHRTFHNSDNFNESSTLLNVELRVNGKTSSQKSRDTGPESEKDYMGMTLCAVSIQILLL